MLVIVILRSRICLGPLFQAQAECITNTPVVGLYEESLSRLKPEGIVAWGNGRRFWIMEVAVGNVPLRMLSEIWRWHRADHQTSFGEQEAVLVSTPASWFTVNHRSRRLPLLVTDTASWFISIRAPPNSGVGNTELT